ncbi:hypothetical protein H4582DRAFT_1914093 [Lactarius indigo]|nr:hypothetical protein H4582DRAFT_1914093 [Lactarius indigo]
MHSDHDAMPGSALFPFDCLDGAQMVLLFSGEVVPWSWSVWNDPRFVDNESMVQLVRPSQNLFLHVNGEAGPQMAAWICHMDTRMRWTQSRDWRAVLLRASKSDSRDAAIAITGRRAIRSIRLVMNFLTLCCNASLRLCSEISVSALVSTVTACASKSGSSQLICHLLTTLSAIGDSRGNTSRTRNRFPGVGVNEIPWEIALSFPPSDLLRALQSSVLAVDHLGSLRTSTTAGIWELGDEALLGLLVAPTLCKALSTLLRQTADELVTWALYSPWARDLCTELRVLFEGNEKTTTTRQILKKRVSVVGRKLLEIVGSHVDWHDEIMWERVYYKGHVVMIVRNE